MQPSKCYRAKMQDEIVGLPKKAQILPPIRKKKQMKNHHISSSENGSWTDDYMRLAKM